MVKKTYGRRSRGARSRRATKSVLRASKSDSLSNGGTLTATQTGETERSLFEIALPEGGIAMRGGAAVVNDSPADGPPVSAADGPPVSVPPVSVMVGGKTLLKPGAMRILSAKKDDVKPDSIQAMKTKVFVYTKRDDGSIVQDFPTPAPAPGAALNLQANSLCILCNTETIDNWRAAPLLGTNTTNLGTILFLYLSDCANAAQLDFLSTASSRDEATSPDGDESKEATSPGVAASSTGAAASSTGAAANGGPDGDEKREDV